MRPPPHQIAGAVLEEAILSVLSQAGFATLRHLHNDLTIDPAAPAVTIRGRGASHQIDAVADPVVAYPFSNPMRLLVEAKAYSPDRRVGLDIVRNAVGTVKDLSEYWRPADNNGRRMTRYHYRYAIFASTEFTEPAQAYAFAQDVYLLPLRRSAFFRPIITAIDELREFFEDERNDWPEGFRLADYRADVRAALSMGENGGREELRGLVQSIRDVQVGLIAVAERQFPLFLVPRTPEVLHNLAPVETVRIFWDDEGWYLRRPDSRENLFSFDLPDELFALYADEGALRQEEAIRLKAERLGAIQAYWLERGITQLVQFRLDQDWISELLRHRQ